MIEKKWDYIWPGLCDELYYVIRNVSLNINLLLLGGALAGKTEEIATNQFLVLDT